MNILVLISLVISIESFVYNLYIGNKWKSVVYAFSLILSLIPAIFSIVEFVTSPRSKVKRLKYAFYSYIYTDQVESFISGKSIEKGYIYCNEFKNMTSNCFHRRSYCLSYNESEENIDFNFLLNVSKIDIGLFINFKMSDNDYLFLINLGYKEKFYGSPEGARAFGNVVHPEELYPVLERFGLKNGLILRQSIMINNLNLSFDYTPLHKTVTFRKVSSIHTKVFSDNYFCSGHGSFIYTLKFISSIKSHNRSCCFVLDPIFKEFKEADLYHCLPINFVIKELLRGIKIKFTDQSNKQKCVESLEEDSMWVKFGSKSKVLTDFIFKTFPDSQTFSKVVSYVVRCESCYKPKSIDVTNWKWKRFAKDLNYLRINLGVPKMCYVDNKVPVSNVVKRYVKERSEEILILNKVSEPQIVISYRLKEKKEGESMTINDDDNLREETVQKSLFRAKKDKTNFEREVSNQIAIRDNFRALRKSLKEKKEVYESKIADKKLREIEKVNAEQDYLDYKEATIRKLSRENYVSLTPKQNKKGFSLELLKQRVKENEIGIEKYKDYTKEIISRLKKLRGNEKMNDWVKVKGGYNGKFKINPLKKTLKPSCWISNKILYNKITDEDHYKQTQNCPDVKKNRSEKKSEKNRDFLKTHKTIFSNLSNEIIARSKKKEKHKKYLKRVDEEHRFQNNKVDTGEAEIKISSVEEDEKDIKIEENERSEENKVVLSSEVKTLVEVEGKQKEGGCSETTSHEEIEKLNEDNNSDLLQFLGHGMMERIKKDLSLEEKIPRALIFINQEISKRVSEFDSLKKCLNVCVDKKECGVKIGECMAYIKVLKNNEKHLKSYKREKGGRKVTFENRLGFHLSYDIDFFH